MKIVHTSIQLCSKQSRPEKTPTTWGEGGGLFIEHLTVHIWAYHCMGCHVWLSTYGHIIAWAVTSDCPHMGTSLHGLWHLTVHIWAHHCMGCHVCPHTGRSLHGLSHLTVHIRAGHCMGCHIWLSIYGQVIAWAVTSDCPHMGMSLHGDYGRKCYYYSTRVRWQTTHTNRTS